MDHRRPIVWHLRFRRLRELNQGRCSAELQRSHRSSGAFAKDQYLRTLLRGINSSTYCKRIPRFDIIHICSAAHFSFLLAPTPAVLLSRLYGKRTILNYRSGQLKDHYRSWHRTLGPTLKLFDRIITPSNYLVDLFAEYGVSSRSIFNTIERESFKFRHRAKLRSILSNSAIGRAI